MEEIIRCIKQHPILYENQKVPNLVKKKKEHWEEVALDLGQSVEAIKKKWVYLRENYQKCIREGKDQKWQWGKELEFLRPHLKTNLTNDTKNTTADGEHLNGTMDDDQEADDDYFLPQKERRMSMFAPKPAATASSSEESEDENSFYAKQMQTPVKLVKETPKVIESETKKSKSEKKAKKLVANEQTPEQHHEMSKSEKKLHKLEKKAKKMEKEQKLEKVQQSTAQKSLNTSLEVKSTEKKPKKRMSTNLEAPSIGAPIPKKPRATATTGVVDSSDSAASTKSTGTPWNPSFDAIELLFLSYAKTLKSFAPKNQAVAKMKIAKIIMEQELLHCDQDERRDSFLEGI